MALDNFRAPSLPIPTDEYDPLYMRQLLRTIELYFGQLDSNAGQHAERYSAVEFFGEVFAFPEGVGGTITQATSKSTAVTLDVITGEITLNNAALAAGTIVTFTLNSLLINAQDQVICTHHSGGTFGAYTINGRATGSGTASIAVRNNTAGSLSEAIVIKFTILKTVTS